MTIARKYGWRRGLPGDRRFPRLALPSYPKLAPAASLMETGFLPPVWDQGSSGSCSGHGTTAAIMYARAKQGLAFIDLSRLFPYWNARVTEGTSASDGGAVIADVVAASQEFGDCPYADLPTDPSLVTVAPPTQAFSDAIIHKTLGATRVWGASGAGLQYHAKHCISVLGLPVVLGFTVYESFESDQVANTGIVPMPGPAEKVLGGHAVLVVAYDDDSQLLTLRNSWGDGWGQKGYFQAPYAFMFDPGVSDDFHSVTLGS
jgi:C1A family cysteine protease